MWNMYFVLLKDPLLVSSLRSVKSRSLHQSSRYIFLCLFNIYANPAYPLTYTPNSQECQSFFHGHVVAERSSSICTSHFKLPRDIVPSSLYFENIMWAFISFIRHGILQVFEGMLNGSICAFLVDLSCLEIPRNLSFFRELYNSIYIAYRPISDFCLRVPSRILIS
jgi:hypothetical protein